MLRNRDLTLAERRALGSWIHDSVAGSLRAFETARPGDARPRAALAALQAWVRGEVNLTGVRPAILAAHAAAREAKAAGTTEAHDIARAAAQAASVAHAAGHALGAWFYLGKVLPPGEMETLAAALPAGLKARVFPKVAS